MKKIIFVLSIGLLFTLTSCDKKTQKKVKASSVVALLDIKMVQEYLGARV